MKSLLTMILAAGLASAARAQKTSEEHHEFAAAKFRLLKPDGESYLQLSAGLPNGATRGASVNVRWDHALNAAGTVVQTDFGGFQSIQETWKSPKVTSYKLLAGGPTVGISQRLFRAGIGDGDGDNGAFVQPALGFGLAPLSFAANVEKNPKLPNGEQDDWPSSKFAPSGYLSAGADILVNNIFSFGAELRRYGSLAGPKVGATFCSFRIGLNLAECVE